MIKSKEKGGREKLGVAIFISISFFFSDYHFPWKAVNAIRYKKNKLILVPTQKKKSDKTKQDKKRS